MTINTTTGEAVIADVTIPFEASSDAFDKARSEKLQKYTPLAEWLKSQPSISSVHVDAFVVGSRGTGDPKNEALVKKLKFGANYAKLFRKLCVIDAFKGSLAIWKSRSTSRT